MGAPTTTRYRVTAPYVTVRTTTASFVTSHRRNSTTTVGLYRDALLPEDTPAEDVDRLLRKGMIEAFEVAA